ncbi:hypothetical protein ACWCPX_09815 [Streptomyces olivaceoviridis]
MVSGPAVHRRVLERMDAMLSETETETETETDDEGRPAASGRLRPGRRCGRRRLLAPHRTGPAVAANPYGVARAPAERPVGAPPG